jgi:flagellar protein FlbT
MASQTDQAVHDLSSHNEIYFPLVRDFLGAAPSAMPLIADINNRILSGDLYKALRSAKKLVAYEQDLIGHALRGERVLESRPGNAVAAGA